jgi:type VI secretion system secreted protein VgrG
MLLSSNADPQASATLQSPQAVASLRGAQNVARRLSDTAVSRQVPPLQANASFDPMIKALDPQQDGKHPETVNGQAASKASFDTRDSSTPVDNIDGARVLVDAPVSLNLATPASAVLHASGNLHTTAHQEAHIAAQQTFAVVAGQAAGIYSDQGGIQAIAGQSPVSLRAHTDALELMADKEVTVTSSEDSIEILAKQRITLQAAGASVTLDGGNITFKGPGVFSVKAASHSFDGPASDPASLPQLPQDRTGAYTQHVVYKDTQGEPFEDMPFDVQHKPGQDTWTGGTQQKGETERVYTDQPQPVDYALRYATFKFDE